MPMNGAHLQELARRYREWLPEYRQRLMAEVEKGGVYGTRQLTPDEQLQRFIEMQPQDYQVLIMRLQQRYAGLQDADDRVNRDISKYISSMVTLMLNRNMMPEQEFQTQLGALNQTVGMV